MNTAADDNIKVLLVLEDKNEANRLLSLLRNASYRIDSKHTDKQDVFNKLIQDVHWDLVIAQIRSESFPARDIFNHIRRQNQDLPVILIAQETDPTLVVEGLRLGAADVVGMDQDQHMLLVVSRTLHNLEQRRKLRQWKRRYYDSESRTERLLQSSRDGIAIIQEGTYLYANRSFARLLDYNEGDDLECMPMLDSIAPEDQDKLKEYLLPITPDQLIETRELEFTAVTANGQSAPLSGVISQVEYKNEPALELLIPGAFASESLDEMMAVEASPSSSSIHLNRVIDSINNAIRRATQKNLSSALLLIEMDGHESLKEELGIAKTEALVTKLSELLQSEVADSGNQLERYQEERFVLVMPNTASDAGLAYAQELCEKVAAQMLELGEQTFNVTLSIGVSVISELSATVESCIAMSEEALKTIHGDDRGGSAGNSAALYSRDEDESEQGKVDIEKLGKALLESEQFKLTYQPIITLHGEPREIYEVLLNVGGEVSPKDLPADFIGQLFAKEIASELDRWVILESVKALSGQLKEHPNTRIFINLSAATICDEEFIPWLKVALKAAGVSPRHLTFQLREIDISRYSKQSQKLVEMLNKASCGVAISHFGLAIEPLKMVNQLKVDYVKFDRVVVDKAQGQEEGEELQKLTNVLLAENHPVIVPFIENAGIISTLWQWGVQYIQGHFLQPPSPRMDYDFSHEE